MFGKHFALKTHPTQAYCPHWTDEETEAQKRETTPLQSPGGWHGSPWVSVPLRAQACSVLGGAWVLTSSLGAGTPRAPSAHSTGKARPASRPWPTWHLGLVLGRRDKPPPLAECQHPHECARVWHRGGAVEHVLSR